MLTEQLLPASGWFSPKMKLFTQGRKNVFSILKNAISEEDKVFWFHAASLGEYEQAVPIIESLKSHFPKHKILVSFFSPSGYENKKNSKLADVIVYLPIDTKENAAKFLDLAHPEIAFFVKYEFWPNYLQELKDRNIKTLLISGIFREDQLFFKYYGKWMQPYLKAFTYFFVQNKKSLELLYSIGFKNATLSGDSRFDRVSNQLKQENHLDFIKEFKGDKLCMVAGSTWSEDIDLMIDSINRSPENVKFIIAPHELKASGISELQQKIKVSQVLYSEKEGKNLKEYNVFIIDTIGILSKIYSYADIAYVGGAAGKTGLHNILEPAIFGVPIITGENISRFPEAVNLKELNGLFSVKNKEDFEDIADKLFKNDIFRRKTGRICARYVEENTGATRNIFDYILKNFP